MDRRPALRDVKDSNHALRWDRDGLKIAETRDVHLILSERRQGKARAPLSRAARGSLRTNRAAARRDDAARRIGH